MNSYSIREIVSVVEELLGENIDVKWGSFGTSSIEQDMYLWTDNCYAEEILKWKPNHDLYEGLKRTIEYYSEEINGSAAVRST